MVYVSLNTLKYNKKVAILKGMDLDSIILNDWNEALCIKGCKNYVAVWKKYGKSMEKVWKKCTSPLYIPSLVMDRNNINGFAFFGNSKNSNVIINNKLAISLVGIFADLSFLM